MSPRYFFAFVLVVLVGVSSPVLAQESADEDESPPAQLPTDTGDTATDEDDGASDVQQGESLDSEDESSPDEESTDGEEVIDDVSGEPHVDENDAPSERDDAPEGDEFDEDSPEEQAPDDDAPPHVDDPPDREETPAELDEVPPEDEVTTEVEAAPADAQRVDETVEELSTTTEESVVVGEELAEEAEPARIQYDADVEYRVRSLRIDPIELSGTQVRDINFTEQRARIDATTALEGVGAIHFQMDALEGVLFGDNGRFLGDPSANSGVSLATTRPNLTRREIGLLPGGDPFDRKDYGPVLVEADLFRVNYLYADAMLPFGLLRVGRQPRNYGATITAHEGGRLNRWGISEHADTSDRILFGTKLDEMVRILATGGDHEPNPSMEEGLIWALFYDFHQQNNIALMDDNLRQMGTNLQWLHPSADWLGLNWRDLRVSATITHLRNEQFNSRLYAFPVSVEGSVNNVDLELQFSHIRGATEEISVGFGALTGDPVVSQRLDAYGARGVIDLHFGPVMLTMETNFATGDANPRPDQPLTAFTFARDLNVGLLLFEHILAFESARSAAVGIENLRDLEMDSFPLTEVRTDGRFTNALAFFPQIYVDLVDRGAHNLFTRLGVLTAWSATEMGAVDAIQTALNDAGGPIEDNALNYHGGLPDRFYGTEIDLQLGYQFRHNFFWTVEGAVLFPGPALHDEHGDAVRSFLVENRFEFIF